MPGNALAERNLQLHQDEDEEFGRPGMDLDENRSLYGLMSSLVFTPVSYFARYSSQSHTAYSSALCYVLCACGRARCMRCGPQNILTDFYT